MGLILYFLRGDSHNLNGGIKQAKKGIPRTVEVKGSKTVSVMSVKATGMKLTVILLVSASGKIAPPVFLYYSRGFTPFTLEEYPDILISSNNRGYNTEDTNYSVVFPHFIRYIAEGSLVVDDECPAHKSDRLKNLLASHQIDHLRIPGGTTCLLQPVDCSIGKFVKTVVRDQFMKWYYAYYESITSPEGKRRKGFKKPSNKQMAEWIMAGVNKLTKEQIVNSFKATGIKSKSAQKLILEEKINRYFIRKAKSLVNPKSNEEEENKFVKKENKNDIPNFCKESEELKINEKFEENKNIIKSEEIKKDNIKSEDSGKNLKSIEKNKDSTNTEEIKKVNIINDEENKTTESEEIKKDNIKPKDSSKNKKVRNKKTPKPIEIKK